MLTYRFRCAFSGRVLAAAFCVTFFSFVFVPDVVWGAPFIVNEWNAVKSSKQLDDGDTFFGTIDGNGGNWIELLVIEDHLDVRGWKLAWTEDEDEDGTPAGNSAGEIIFSNAALWSDLRAGTLVTLIEKNDAGGFDTSTDTSFDPFANDWTINVATREEQAKGVAGLLQTTTNDGSPGDFSVGQKDWSITIFDDAMNSIFGPVGEGEASWQGDGIGKSEAGSLEGPGATATLADWQAVSPSSNFYDDTSSSSFGGYNVDFSGGAFTQIQDPSALQGLVVPEPSSVGLLSIALLMLARRKQRACV
ncbi:MAG: PEP-CTERM sorting domain-containing protein [Planctomycetes bacterium]|nr:PEP-CTERM sorting domain-containing protein [Planctomycetota bacterium]